MTKGKKEEQMVLCPVGRLFRDLEKARGKPGFFFGTSQPERSWQVSRWGSVPAG